MLFETEDGHIAQDVFVKLSETLRRSQYKINDQEKQAFSDCSAEIGGSLLTWCGTGAAAGYIIARNLGNGSRWGKFVSMTAGCYVGTQVALRGIKERCLERIVALPTPLGAEAAALLREHAPQSRLLRVVPPAPEGGDAQAVPRLAAIAAMQRAHQRAGVDVPANAMFGSSADSQREAADQSPIPMSVGNTAPQPAPRPRSHPGQQPPLEAQPYALGLSGDLFGGNSSSSGSSQHDDWSGDQRSDDSPQGLQTVHRHRRPRRGFGASESGEQQSPHSGEGFGRDEGPTAGDGGSLSF